MSYAEESYWPPQNPEHPINNGLRGSIRESLNRIYTPAPQIEPEEELKARSSIEEAREEGREDVAVELEEGIVYTDYDELGRYCLSDGTVVFNQQYETGQLEIGDSHVLVLAYGQEFYEGYGPECAVVLYELDASRNIAKRIIIMSSGIFVREAWVLEKFRNKKHDYKLTSNKPGYLERGIRSRKVEDITEAVGYAVNNPCSDETPRKLDHLSSLDRSDRLSTKGNQRRTVDIRKTL